MEAPQVAAPTTNGTAPQSLQETTRSPSGSPPISPKAALEQSLVAKIGNFTPQVQLTGAAAMANRRQNLVPRKSEEKEGERNQISPNPAATVLQQYPMSKPTDAPPQTNMQRGLAALPGIATAANAIDAVNGEGNGSSDSSLLQPPNEGSNQFTPISPNINRNNSLEGLSATTPTTPGFGPNSAVTPITPFSPNAITTPGGGKGRHVCPHCNQGFTRHHNLKSHLLTHSHEKPFFCQTCSARFRRLHDLKRHQKLHTGERPHNCNKCGRRFARGDALARHSRAEGGCAGRRGSHAGGEDGLGLGEATQEMDGLDLMEGDADGDVDMIGGNDAARRRSLPSIRTDFSNTAGPITPASGSTTGSTSGYVRSPNHSQSLPSAFNTYTPSSASSLTRTTSASGPLPTSGNSLFAQQRLNALKSPQSATSPHSKNTIPTPSSANSAANPNSTLSPRGNVESPPQEQQRPGPTSAFAFFGNGAPTANMATSPVAPMLAAGLEHMWTYIRALEDRVMRVEERNVQLSAEVQTLRAGRRAQGRKTSSAQRVVQSPQIMQPLASPPQPMQSPQQQHVQQQQPQHQQPPQTPQTA